MKNNRMKTIGITVGVCAALWFAPTSVQAMEDGNGLKLDANLLNEKEGKAAILDIQAENIPLVGDLNVRIPSITNKEDNKKSSALATVEIADGDIVEDLNIAVLEGNKSADDDSEQKKSALATVELETPLTEEVNVDVLSADRRKDSESSSFDGGLVEVNAPDLPILGETHVGVLDKHTQKDGEGSSYSSGLVQADLNGELLKDTSVRVLATTNLFTENETSENAVFSLVSVKVDEESLGGLVEDLNVSVLENKKSETAETELDKSSLASIELTTPLTEEVNVDVLSADRRKDSESSSFDGGLVEVNAPDLPILGETHVGVLDKHTQKDGEGSSYSSGLVQADLNGELLKDTSVTVLATTNLSTENGASENAISSLVSAKVDEESLGGLVEDLNVSVLENKRSETAETEVDKSSLASIGLTTPLTEEVNVDVLAAERKIDSESSSFDGGLVEVNAPDLPILGETHVGVLDKHTQKNGEGSSHSSGLVQADLDGELLKDTSVTVLAENRFSNAEGTTVRNDGASVQLVTDLIGAVNLDILTNERFYPNMNVVLPTPDTPPGPDVTIPTPDNDKTPGTGNGDGTVDPGTGNPGNDVDKEQGFEQPAPGIVDPGTGNDNEQNSEQPGSAQDNPSSTSPDLDNGDNQDSDNAVNATGPGTNNSNGGVSVQDPNDNIANSFSDEFASNAFGNDNSTNMSTALGFDFGKNGKTTSDSTSTNMSTTLPKTGGLLNGTLLLLLSLLLLASGVGIRRAVS